MTDHRPETWGLADDGIDDARRLGLSLRNVVSHGTVVSAWLSRQIPGCDAVGFWEDLEMPAAWLVDLHARSAHRIAVHEGPDLPD